MGHTVNYWKIKDNVINRNNMNYIYTFHGHFYMNEIKDKAKELYKQYKNEWEGILLRIIRTNAWDEPINSYYLYYNGKRFIKDPEYIYFDNKDIIDYIKSIK